MKKLLRYAAVGMSTIGLGLGVAAASTATIETTGPDSTTDIVQQHENNAKVKNNNRARVDNDNDQTAVSGDASVAHNTEGGDAESGEAANDNATDTAVSVDNTGAWGGLGGLFDTPDHDASVSLTGPDSHQSIVQQSSNNLKVENNNRVDVRNDNDQTAVSGDAKVWGNTTGGSATSGAATNTNTTTTTVEISN